MQHADLTPAKWFKLSLYEQMANIGSEIFRSINWKDKGNQGFADSANLRALELFDLTLADSHHGLGIREIARARELWLDYFLGGNHYHQTADLWQRYFYAFTYAARNKTS